MTTICKLFELVKKYRQLTVDAENELSEALNLRYGYTAEDPFFIVVGFHECEESPIGLCLYNTDEDCGAHRDICILCNQPEERK